MQRFYNRCSTPFYEPLLPKSSNRNQASESVDKRSEKRPRIEVETSDVDIIDDPGLQKSINSYPYEIRDSLLRRYLAKGPCQPFGHKFPQKIFQELREDVKVVVL